MNVTKEHLIEFVEAKTGDRLPEHQKISLSLVADHPNMIALKGRRWGTTWARAMRREYEASQSLTEPSTSVNTW